MKITDKKKAERYLEKLRVVRESVDIDPFESKEIQENRIIRSKTDIKYFAQTYFKHYCEVESADFHFEFAYEVKKNPVIKAFAEWGRGLAKSVWCDIIIVLWLWVNREADYLVLVSDSKDRASDLLEDLQIEFEANPLLIKDYGEQFNQGNWERGNFTTLSGFTAKAFGVRQKVRGLRKKNKRPNICIIDDLETPDTIKNRKRQEQQADWIERDLIPTMIGKFRRLLYANNRFASVMTQTILQERHPKWFVHHIKAYDKATHEPRWKAMYTAEFYRQQEEDMGVLAALAEYNHEATFEGRIFKNEHIQWAKLPPLEEFTMVVIMWDIAYTDNATSDYNAVRMWGLHNNNFWLIDCYVRQSKMRLAVDWICNTLLYYKGKVVILSKYEAQFWNEEVQRTIEESEIDNGVETQLYQRSPPKVLKYSRMIRMYPYYQNGRIYYNEAIKAKKDTQTGLQQLFALEPDSKEHDDVPDSDEQAIDELERYNVPKRKSDGRSYRTGKMKKTHEQP